MQNSLQKKLYEQGFLKVKNVLNFKRDLKPILNDMEFVMDCLVQKYAKKKDIKKVLKYDFKKKYSYISKLNIHDLDQYFNTRLPRDHVKKESDYFATQSLWNLINNKKVLDVVEKILGKEIMSNPVQNTRIKQPEKKLPKGSILDGLSGRTPWHQDAAVLNPRGQKLTDMVTVWIPFTKTTIKNGCMITVKKINKMGLLNHVSGYRGQVELKNSELFDFRISADLRYNIAGQPSGREPLPNFYVRSKNKKNLKIKNFKQWLALWEKAKEKCIQRKYAFKYPLPTFKNNKKDLSKLV